MPRAFSAIARRSGGGAEPPRRRLGGQVERREEPPHGVGLRHRAEDPPRAPQRGQTRTSIAKKALTLAPNNPRAYNNLAWIYAEQKKNLDEALTLAQRATELLPNDASTLDTLGWVQYARGAYAEAEPLFRKAAELAGDSAPIQYSASFETLHGVVSQPLDRAVTDIGQGTVSGR